MRTQIYLNGKKITQKAAADLLGKEKLKQHIAEAKEGFMRDPLEEQSWYTGSGMLTIKFK